MIRRRLMLGGEIRNLKFDKWFELYKGRGNDYDLGWVFFFFLRVI